MTAHYDAVIVGGGFYGAAIAIYLKTQRSFGPVLLVEREADLFMRASYTNQARIHNGYHYPRSYTTAFRSRVNSPRFARDYPLATKRDFTMLYAIARHNSKVTARQFRRFCHEVGAELQPAPRALQQLFEPRLVEAVFVAEEYAFDASKLRVLTREELTKSGVDVWFESTAKAVTKRDSAPLTLLVVRGSAPPENVTACYVFNCTYSGLNQLAGHFPGTQTELKHELTELAVMKLPPVLANLGITVMDGPFFSVMPFPSRGLHTLTHVRYTPHLHWTDRPGEDPSERLGHYHREPRIDRMIRDVRRYLPAISSGEHVESLFEIKTVLVRNESDDGRPILFERHTALPNCYSVLGGKIDNIYDVLEKLDSEPLPLERR